MFLKNNPRSSLCGCISIKCQVHLLVLMHSKSLARRYHTYSYCNNRLSFFTDAVSPRHVIFQFYSRAKVKHSFILEIKILFNIRNVLCEGNISSSWSTGSEIYVEGAQHEERTYVLKSVLHFLPLGGISQVLVMFLSL